MIIQSRLIPAIFIGVSLFGLQACNNNTSDPAASSSVDVCESLDIRARCILETAEATLLEIDTGFEWATSAAELAIAYNKQGSSDRAWTLMSSAVDRLETIEDVKKHNSALGDIALALPKLKANKAGKDIVLRLETLTASIEDEDKQADVIGKLITASAVHGDINAALSKALLMPNESDAQDAYRGRTLREVSAQFAKQGDFDSALSAIDKIDSRFTYYGGVARTDVASIAAKSGNKDIIENLLQGAEKIAEIQDNGYFSAGIRRDIGYTLITMGEEVRGAKFIETARDSARDAKSMQEKARSMSRIGTRLADAGQMKNAQEIIAEAFGLAQKVESEVMQNYSNYEIAGSAAFAGDFATSVTLITSLPDAPFGSTSSLKGVSQRDLAWGYARNGELEKALETANAITAKREKVHALSRIVRLIADPKMNALPRYL